jgi:glutamate synthase domain-containing protein 1
MYHYTYIGPKTRTNKENLDAIVEYLKTTGNIGKTKATILKELKYRGTISNETEIRAALRTSGQRLEFRNKKWFLKERREKEKEQEEEVIEKQKEQEEEVIEIEKEEVIITEKVSETEKAIGTQKEQEEEVIEIEVKDLQKIEIHSFNFGNKADKSIYDKINQIATDKIFAIVDACSDSGKQMVAAQLSNFQCFFSSSPHHKNWGVIVALPKSYKVI